MNNDIKAKDTFNELMQLMKENPDLSVIPMVSSDVVASDDFTNWAGSFKECRLDKALNGFECDAETTGIEGLRIDDERIYFYSCDDEDIADKINDALDDISETYEESDIDKLLNSLPWQDVIVVNIGIPE